MRDICFSHRSDTGFLKSLRRRPFCAFPYLFPCVIASMALPCQQVYRMALTGQGLKNTFCDLHQTFLGYRVAT
ncbi:hypothetical protein mEp515_19 [Escherichia phage mEp515]